jgi:hypothetical protein
MKKYLLFCFYINYPGGGWNDYVGQYETIEEAMKNIQAEFYHIVDIETMKIIKSGKR